MTKKKIKKGFDDKTAETGGVDALVANIIRRREEQGQDTIVESPGVGDVDRIVELADHVGPAVSHFKKVVEGVLTGNDVGHGGYSHRLAVIRATLDEPCEGFNDKLGT